MKTREEFISNCRYPILPENSGSIYNAYYSSEKNTKAIQGGRVEEASSDFFILSSQFQKIKYFVSKSCRLFFAFDKKAENVSWKEVFPFLRAGDHLMVYIENGVTQTDSFTDKISLINIDTEVEKDKSVKVGYNIEKVVLLSVNKQNRVLSRFFMREQIYKDWFLFLDLVHCVMKQIGLDRVETSTLVNCPGTEPDLDLFETKLYDGTMRKLFLSTSPEIQMKRLICRGWTDIYEVKKCFRNNESGPVNYREFYLLEWYRAYSGLGALIGDIQFLFNFLSKKIRNSPFPKLKKISMAELFKKYLNMDLCPHSSKSDFVKELNKRNIPYEESDDINDLFYLLFLNKIEPYLDKDTPLIVYNYPSFQKAYARIGWGGWASRFELFWKGMELANAFDEVIKPEEQKERFEEDGLKREKKGKQPVPPAYQLLNDMEGGMPPTSGVALGLDRLFLALKNLNDIKWLKVISDEGDK